MGAAAAAASAAVAGKKRAMWMMEQAKVLDPFASSGQGKSASSCASGTASLENDSVSSRDNTDGSDKKESKKAKADASGKKKGRSS